MDGNNSPGGSQAPIVQPQAGTDEQSASSSSGGAPPMDPDDWRAQLTLEFRQRVVSKIVETLENHVFSAQEGLQGLKKIAVRYEEKIYSAATSQFDYLRKISLTMFKLETKAQVPMAYSLQTGVADASRISSDIASNSMQSQIHNLGLAMPIVGGESQASQNMQNNISAAGVQNSGSLASTLPAGSNPTQGSIANAVGQNSSLQKNSSVAKISVMKQKLQPGGMKWHMLQPHAQKQHQNLIQTGQIQSSQQAVMQPMIMQPTMMQNHQSSGQQSFQQILEQQPQPVLGQHHQQPTQQFPIPHQQQTSMAQQPMMQTAQQTQLQPLIGQVSSDSGIQQNQLLKNIEVLRLQLGLMCQQNDIANLQQQQSISQLNNIPNTHQLQLGGGVSGLQQSTVPGMQSIASSGMPNIQHSVHMLQQMQQNVSLLQNQTQQPQPQPQPQTSQQQMVSQIQPQSGHMPHLQLQSNSLQPDMRQKLPTSGAMIQQHNLAEQQKQFCQSQEAIQEASSTPLDSTAQTENSGAGDWQEEVYQKIKSMKAAYFLELNEMYLKMATKLQLQDGLPQKPNNEQLSKLKFFKVMLERLVQFLQLSKNEVQKDHKDKLGKIEKQIIDILNSGRPRKPASLQPRQLPQPDMQNSQPQSQISQIQTQPLNPQTSSATMAQNNLSALHQNALSSVPLISTSLMNSLQQPSSSLGLGQNSSPLSLQLPQTGIQNSQPQSQISQMQAQPLNLQTSAATMAQNNVSALHQNTLSSVPSISNSLINSVQQPSFSFGLGQNSSLISPQQVAVNSLQRNIAHSGPQSLNPLGPLITSQAGGNALQPNLNPLSLQTYSGLLQNPYLNPQLQQLQQMRQQQMQQQQLHYQQLMKLQPSAQLPALGHPSPQINQQNLVTSLTKTEMPLQSADSSVVVPAPSTPVAPSPMNGESEKVNASPSSHPSTNTAHLQAPNAAGSSALSLAPGHPSPQINQQDSVTYLIKTGTPLRSADSPSIVPSPSTHVAPSPMHAESEKVNASLSSHLDTEIGHIQAPNAAGSSALPVAISITNTNTGYLEAPNAAGSSVLPLSISIGGSEIVNARLSSQPNTHIIHLEAPNPAGSSAKPLAISVTITIA